MRSTLYTTYVMRNVMCDCWPVIIASMATDGILEAVALTG